MFRLVTPVSATFRPSGGIDLPCSRVAGSTATELQMDDRRIGFAMRRRPKLGQ